MGVEGVAWFGQNNYWESCIFNLTIWLNILFVTMQINKAVLDTFIQINTQIIKITTGITGKVFGKFCGLLLDF